MVIVVGHIRDKLRLRGGLKGGKTMLKYCWGKDGDGGGWLKDDERIVVRMMVGMVVRLKVRLAGKALSNVIRMDVRLND